jgi:hypothetical protein
MLKNNILLKIFQKELGSLAVFLHPYFVVILGYFNQYKWPAFAILISLVVIWMVYLLIRLYLTWFESKRETTLFEVSPPILTEQSSFTTAQLFTSVHGLLRQRSWIARVFDITKSYSFEIVSTKEKGIRYILRVSTDDADIIKKTLIAYLSGIEIKEADDYLKSNTQGHIIDFHLIKHFAFPLKKQDNLEEYDPIAYVTGAMTKLTENEIVAVQMVVSPISRTTAHTIGRLRGLFLGKKDVLSELQTSNSFWNIFLFLLHLLLQILLFPLGLLIWILTTGREGPILPIASIKVKLPDSTYKDIAETQIKQKIDQQLFTASLRFLTVTNSYSSRSTIEKGFLAALSSFTNAGYQSLKAKRHIRLKAINDLLLWFYQRRLLNVTGNLILSTSELSDLYHFPYTSTTQTEDIVKVHSKELPAPLSVKNNSDFDVVFGKNTYANSNTDIGLTDEDRSRHVYIIGQTGSGKTTIMFHMVKDDINKGRGVAVIDPHGDLAEDLLTTVPNKRIDDCIYFNPFDLRYPIGINLLELNPGLKDDELEQEKELVCESVISVFRRVFSKDENTDAHRIEYILRNTIYTAFTVPNATIFTVYDLLNDPKYQKSITNNLEDENLQNFWKNEFGRAGNFQVVKMVSGVTARIGRFLFSPTAKRILEQPKSTINFDEILSSGKILICNLAEGKLGEDTSQLLGTTIIAKLQQAAMRRVRTKLIDRTPFYLFIDEFQNFATTSFTKLLSGGRKFGLRLTIAEQSTSQQEDRNVVNVILANTGTVICFRTASPVDEQLMLAQFTPYVSPGDIVNLPRYRFYMKLSAVEPEEPFSGETIPIVFDHDQDKVQEVVEASRNNFAIKYEKPVSKITSSVVTHKPQKTVKIIKEKPQSKGLLPDDIDE